MILYQLIIINLNIILLLLILFVIFPTCFFFFFHSTIFFYFLLYNLLIENELNNVLGKFMYIYSCVDRTFADMNGM